MSSAALLLGRLKIAQGAPIQNLTALHTDVAPRWVADPPGRGTWSLLYSCVFTLVLCVWTSIHLNVPPQDDTTIKYWVRKIKWVICALFAPEIVLFAAFQQWLEAWRFLKELNMLAAKAQAEENKKEEEISKKKPRYTMIYAYYAVMGGFTVDISHLHDFLPRATMTTNGILFLATHGHFLQITEDSIKDKSKADIIAKGLVCVQVLWVIGQAIERKITGYPTTLLEVHTIVHIVCALILYALWIRKPQDVRDPTLISSEDLQGAIAFMVLCSRFKSHREPFAYTYEEPRKENGDITFEKPIRYTAYFNYKIVLSWYGHLDQVCTPVDPVTLYGPSAYAWSRRVELPAEQQQSGHVVTHYKSTGQDSQGTTKEYTACNILKNYAPAGNPPPETVLMIYSGQALDSGLGPMLPWHSPRWPDSHDKSKPSAAGSGVKLMLSQKQLTMLDMAGVFIRRNHLSDGAPHCSICLDELNDKIRGYRSRMLSFREANLKYTLFKQVGQHTDWQPLLAAALVLITTAYGGVHLAALSIMFPTPVERLMWKVACYLLITIAAGVGGYSVCVHFLWSFIMMHERQPAYRVYYLRYLLQPAQYLRLIYHQGLRRRTYDNTAAAPAHLIFGIVAPAYVAARLYIVIEAFISLRHVPIGVYQTPESNFMDYIPHL